MKPEWKNAPEWAQWLAQDGSGKWNWFERKPVKMDDIWVTKGSEVASAGRSDPAGVSGLLCEARPVIAHANEWRGLSPNEMKILLAAFRTPEPIWVGAQPGTATVSQTRAIAHLVAEDLVIPVVTGQCQITERGRAWVERALATPLPHQQTVWVFE